jgi:hypothetical protein
MDDASAVRISAGYIADVALRLWPCCPNDPTKHDTHVLLRRASDNIKVEPMGERTHSFGLEGTGVLGVVAPHPRSHGQMNVCILLEVGLCFWDLRAGELRGASPKTSPQCRGRAGNKSPITSRFDLEPTTCHRANPQHTACFIVFLTSCIKHEAPAQHLRHCMCPRAHASQSRYCPRSGTPTWTY